MPLFDRIRPEHFEPAFDEAMRVHREELARIGEQVRPPDFDNTVAVFDRAGRLLSRVGAVRGPELFAIETYATVHQMVSRVTGRLIPGTPLSTLLPFLDQIQQPPLVLEQRQLPAHDRPALRRRQPLDLGPQQVLQLMRELRDVHT